MGKQFGRRIAVTIDTLRIEGLDMRFRIEKSLRPEPNKSEVVIFNLNADHRRALQEDRRILTKVEVGYGDGPLQQIFLGEMRQAFSVYEPPDWKTTIRSGDGEDEHKTKRVARSFTAGTDVRTVVQEAANALSVGLGNAAQAIQASIMRGNLAQFSSGKVLSGLAAKELDTLMGSMKLEYSIQDRQLQVIAIGQALAGAAVLLTPDTGLIGSPEPGTKGLIRGRALLQPLVFPGRQVEIQSQHMHGFFRVEKVSYSGDVAGQEWYVDFECRRLGVGN